MKRLSLIFFVPTLLSPLGLYAQQATTYKGEITDSYCAPKGSHPDPDAKKCTVDCVKMGATYVLYNAADKTVYQLDDQKKPVAFAGKNVSITGTLDKATKTIHVTDIKAS